MSKKFDLEEFKKSIKLADTPLKKDKFVILDECLHSVLGVPGIPLGHITMVFGPSDTGKTSLLFHSAAQAQKQGILPVLIVTEGKISHERLALMGFDPDFAIINESCEFLEDVFTFIDTICAKAASGDLPHDIVIFFDSIGNTLSKEEIEVQKDGTWEKKNTMMKCAKIISENMRTISKKINDTRKVSYPKSVGLFIVNQAYTSPPSFPGGRPSLTPYGGTAIYYRSSLVIRTKKAKKLTAIKDKVNYGFGIVAKFSVDKNHISNTTNSGEFIITADKIIPNEPTALKNYKNENKDTWGEEIKITETEES